MKFILSRTTDYLHHSKKWIVGYGILFWLVTRILAMAIMMGCVAIYNSLGINPEKITKFSGNPENVNQLFSVGYGIVMIGLIAPILEECIFRLGLSFKKWQIGIGLAAIPVYIFFPKIATITVAASFIYLGAAAVAFCLIYFLTTQKAWNENKTMYYHSAIWISSIAFGLIHLIAFSQYSLELIPYMLCVILIPFFAGCAIAYYRINLGFWWGVALHIFNNIPGIIMLACM